MATPDGGVALIEACRDETYTAIALAVAFAQGAGVVLVALFWTGCIGSVATVIGTVGTVLVLAFLLTWPFRRAVRALTDDCCLMRAP